MIGFPNLSSSLYHRLLISHMQIAGVAALLICVCLLMSVYFQRSSSIVANIRLPASMATARVVNGIEASNSQLRSWVLLGSVDRIDARQRTWAEKIEPAMNELDVLAGDKDLAAVAALRRMMEQLKESQWWVEEIATSAGNNPARLIYDRDLLPIYELLQRSVAGLDNNTGVEKNGGDIRLTTALLQQKLSAAVRQLSEAMRTGSIAEIRAFRRESETVRNILARLADQIAPGDDSRLLLAWIIREYHFYEQLAQQTIVVRQADDWNRALYILRSETEPLARAVKNTLGDLERDYNELLQQEATRSALISRVGVILTLSMVVGLGVIAWAVARGNSNRLVAPIESLARASDQLANIQDPPVQLPVQGPREIAHLTERFNYMARELTARTKDLQHATRELQAYTHIITHDLKTPLINIKGHAGLIKTQLQALEAIARDDSASGQSVRQAVLRTVTEDIPESVDFIDLSITKTNTLVGGVLDNSRLLFRGIALENVDMNKLVEQVIAQFSHRFPAVEICCSTLPVVRTDPFLMEHVFSNLVDNALKYLDPGRAGHIEIRSESRAGEAHFFVSDNGIGLKDARIDVFKLFEQAAAGSKGAGIGLALVQTMLTKLGGRIGYETNDEYGTTFMFCVPLYHERLEAVAAGRNQSSLEIRADNPVHQQTGLLN